MTTEHFFMIAVMILLMVNSLHLASIWSELRKNNKLQKETNERLSNIEFGE